MTMFFKGLSLAALVVTLASCGGADGTKVGTTGEKVAGSESSSEKKTQSFKLNDQVKLGDYIITVTKFLDNVAPPDEFTTPEAGKKFVAVEVLYENPTSDKTIDSNPHNWTLSDSDSYNYDYDPFGPKSPGLDAVTVNPGSKTRGWINFQTPKDAQRFKVQFKPGWFDDDNVVVELY